MTTATWTKVAAAIEGAPYPVSVETPDSQRAVACLSTLGLSTKSWLGAVVSHSAGLFVDHGWLRVLGSGSDTLPDILAGADRAAAHLPVAYDVLGGTFAWTPNDAGQPTIHYFGPDDLGWQDLGQGYADWLYAVLAGSLDRFYDGLRWPGWQQEVAATRPDEGISTWPPPWSEQGRHLSVVSRKTIPVAELVALNHDAARQLGSTP